MNRGKKTISFFPESPVKPGNGPHLGNTALLWTAEGYNALEKPGNAEKQQMRKKIAQEYWASQKNVPYNWKKGSSHLQTTSRKTKKSNRKSNRKTRKARKN